MRSKERDKARKVKVKPLVKTLFINLCIYKTKCFLRSKKEEFKHFRSIVSVKLKD